MLTNCHDVKMFHWQNFPLTKCTIDKMYHWQNVPLTKCHGQNVTLTKCTIDKMSLRQNVPLTKCPIDKMSLWQNDQLTKWPIDKMTNWQNVTLTKCPIDKMSHWQNATLTKCHLDRMSEHLKICQIWSCSNDKRKFVASSKVFRAASSSSPFTKSYKNFSPVIYSFTKYRKWYLIWKTRKQHLEIYLAQARTFYQWTTLN
jgi:hypothetical protein